MAATTAIIASAITAATGLATTGLALSKGSPDFPDVKPPPPPPAPPPAPAPLPPAPTETEAGEGVAAERRKRQTRFSVADTLLTSPLGPGGVPGGGGRSLLGGG